MVVFIKGLKKFDGIRSLFSGVTNTRKVMSDVASMIASLMASGIGPEQAASAAAAFYAQHAATAPKTKTKAKAKVPATEKKEKTLKVFAEGEQCLARVWQTAGEFGAQCNRAKKDGCDFCAFHQLNLSWMPSPPIFFFVLKGRIFLLNWLYIFFAMLLYQIHKGLSFFGHR